MSVKVKLIVNSASTFEKVRYHSCHKASL